ncbi:MAG TPA: hypothetical protein VIG53_05825 [Actinomycetota bacterium]|jgi:hypothetical protein
MKPLVRWLGFGALAIVVAAIVQSVRHPARLWSSGVMGRVLAWGMEPTRPPGETAP